MNTAIFRSLRHRNYRLFFAGQIVSVTGTWIQATAMPWLVYRITGSALLLGTVAFLSQISILLLSPLAGTLADHVDRKRMIVITQALAMAQALLLGVLTLTGTVQVWHIVVLALMLGAVNAFDMPARQSFVVDLVGKEDLPNAIGLNSMVFNSGRLVGPAIAALLLAWLGEGMCFLLNGFSYVAVLAALFFIAPLARTGTAHDSERSMVHKFKSGLAYVLRSEELGPVLLLLAVTGMTGVFPSTLMPVLVKDVFRLGAPGMGLFMSAIGAGALAGTLRLASQTRSAEAIKRTIFRSALAFSVCVTALGLTRALPLALALAVCVGFALVLQMGLTNTFIQVTTPDELRGRVMGFYIMGFMGFAPLGSLLAGFLAHRLSAMTAITVGGVISLVFAIIVKNSLFRGHRAAPAQ